jgi:hypothetical protein
MSFDYIQRHYGVPAERGREVVCYGERGVIVGADGHYICVVIDGDPSECERRYHPTDKVAYGDIVERAALREWECLAPWRDAYGDWPWFRVTASTRSKARYKAYLELSDIYDMSGSDMIRIRVRAVPKLKPIAPGGDGVPPSDDPDVPF